MALPNSVASAPSIAYAGQIAEPGAPKYARSAVAEGASIVAGKPVKRGTNKEKQVLPFGASDVPDFQNFAGIVLLETSRPTLASGAGGIAAGDPVSILRLGSVYLQFSEIVTAGERVGIVLADSTLVGLGEDESPADNVRVLPGCRIAQTITAAGLARVEVNLYGQETPGDLLAESPALAFVANDLVIQDDPQTHLVIDIPATAGISTVTLPADAVEGTQLTFVADGVKNAHTVQYRDVATAITAALTAAKRHQVRCVFLNGGWTALAHVSP